MVAARIRSVRDLQYRAILAWRAISNINVALAHPDRFRYFHIYRDDIVVGTMLIFAAASFRNRTKPGHMELSFKIAPEFRRAGLASCALALAVDYCERLKQPRMYALVRETNVASIRLCRKFFAGEATFARSGIGPFASYAQLTESSALQEARDPDAHSLRSPRRSQ